MELDKIYIYHTLHTVNFEYFYQSDTFAWRQLWNFITFQMRLNAILQLKNKDFWYFVWQFDVESWKTGHFYNSGLIFEAIYQTGLSKYDFSIFNHIRTTSFINKVFTSIYFEKVSSSKIIPNFWHISIKSFYKI